MKNPMMSWWLSEWHKAANAAKGQMMAEMTRQQNAMMAEWQKNATEMWMAMFMPWSVSAGKPQQRSKR